MRAPLARRWHWLATAATVLALCGGCATLAPRDAAPSHAIAGDHEHGLGRIAADSLGGDGGSAFRPLPMADFALDARLALIERAERSLDLQYYQVDDDATSHQLLRALRDAAARGVRVRLLVDDLYTAGNRTLLLGLAAHSDVEVRLFNPFAAGRSGFASRFVLSLWEFGRVNHRMHNKLFIADGAFAIAGGRNIGDAYFRRSRDGNFVDFDLLLAGAVVPELAAIFDGYWNSPHVYPLQAVEQAGDDAAARRAAFDRQTADAGAARAPLAADAIDRLGRIPVSAELARPPLQLSRGSVRARADDPDKVSGSVPTARSVSAQFVAAVAAARTRVTLASPYFIPGEVGLQALRNARARGVQIELLTNTLAANDEPFAAAAYARYRPALLQMGVQIHELSSQRMKMSSVFRDAVGAGTGRSHAKLAVIDDHIVFVGSMNMDLRSARDNTELGLWVDSAELAAQVNAMLALVRAGGTYRLRLDERGERVLWIAGDDGTVVLDDEPELPLATRLKLNLLSPLVPEALL